MPRQINVRVQYRGSCLNSHRCTDSDGLMRTLQRAGGDAGDSGPSVAFLAGSHALLHDFWIEGGKQVPRTTGCSSSRFGFGRASDQEKY
jgi:hypothetical protein